MLRRLPKAREGRGVEIHPASFADVKDIIEVTKHSEFTSFFRSPFYANRQRFADQLNIVAKMDGQIVGLSAIRHKKRLPESEIDILATHPEFRSKGVGAALVKYCLEKSPHHKLVLNVHHENPRALQFYKREGFIKIGTARNDTCDRLMLQKGTPLSKALRGNKTGLARKLPKKKSLRIMANGHDVTDRMPLTRAQLERMRPQSKGRSAEFAYTDELTPIEKHGDYWLKRDDLYRAAGAPGGKARSCWALAQGAKGLTAASHRLSPQMHMVARVAAALEIPCHIHTATGNSDQIEDARSFGAKIIHHTPGYNNVLIARAREDAAKRGWKEIPFGMESPQAVNLTGDQVVNIPKGVKRIVCAVGIGMSLSGILQGMKRKGLKIPVLAVAVGAKHPEKFIDRYAPQGWRKHVELVRSPVDYHTPVVEKIDGVLLDPIYEAKCVQFMRPGDLLWIIGIRASLK